MRLLQLLPKLVSYFVPMLVLFIVTPIFTETFGSTIFHSATQPLKNESKLIFYVTSVCGQIFLPLISSINSGLLVLPMFELSEFSKAIAKKSLCTGNALLNTIFCTSVATVLTSVLCMAIFAFRQGKLLSKMPLNIIDALFITSGFFNLVLGFGWFMIADRVKLSVVLSIVSLIVTATAILILSNTGNPRFLIVFLLALIGSTNLLKMFYSENELIKYHIFTGEKSSPLDFASIITELKRGGLTFGVIKDNIFNIIGLAISPIITLSTTLPFYAKRFKLDINYNKELRNFGISSLTHLFFPANISCTGSVLFKVCGAETRIHSLLAGVSLIGLYFVYEHITPLLSTFVLSLMPQFIGISVLAGYAIPVSTYTFADKAVLGVLVMISLITKVSGPIVLAVGLAINFLTAYYFSGSVGGEVTLQEINGVVIVKVQDCLTYANMTEVTEGLKGCDCSVVFDLSDVKYVDYTGNQELGVLIHAITKNGWGVEIIGKPYNLNEGLLSDCKPRDKQLATADL